MIRPSCEEAAALCGTANVVPVYATILADTETPVSLWLKLFRQAEHSFLLESVTGGDSVARYSFLGGDPFMTFRATGARWSVQGSSQMLGDAEPLTALRDLMSQYKPVQIDGLPRFSGGAVGYFSYDSVRLWEDIPDRHQNDTALDEIFFGFYRDLIVFDNRQHKVLFISNIIVNECDDFKQAYSDACSRIAALMDRLQSPLPSEPVKVGQVGPIVSNVARESFEQAVEKCKEYIKAGDIFQVVLSQRFSVEVDAQPFDLYRLLRTVNPSPYMYYLSLGSNAVIGASPEMLVRVQDRCVEVRPIAGTSPRGVHDLDDERLARELLADEKEIAEHVMLVDLGRNDVGRVSDYGTVRVEDMMHIERYSHVMHIVSNVLGRLKDGLDAFDALGSCFPAGTLSGAPKIRAMQIIDELEQRRRGLYGGALGYIDFDGTMDMCIVIRTILFSQGVANVQVGAGIVADSVPQKEFEETVHKANALFTAIRDAGMIIGR